MKPIYPRMNTLIESLDLIPGARRDDALTEGDGPGEYLAEEIRSAQRHLKSPQGLADEAEYSSDADESGADGGDPPSPIFWFPDEVVRISANVTAHFGHRDRRR